MPYRIKVCSADCVGDVLVKLQYRANWCPIWTTIEYTWIFKHSNMDTALAEAKRQFQRVAQAHANPKIFPHVEVLDV